MNRTNLNDVELSYDGRDEDRAMLRREDGHRDYWDREGEG